jgi:hypothetical protein
VGGHQHQQLLQQHSLMLVTENHDLTPLSAAVQACDRVAAQLASLVTAVMSRLKLTFVELDGTSNAQQSFQVLSVMSQVGPAGYYPEHVSRQSIAVIFLLISVIFLMMSLCQQRLQVNLAVFTKVMKSIT